MKSITIHALDDAVEAQIRKRAQREGASLNKTIKKLLAEALGLQTGPPPDNRQDFLDLFGSWSAGEVREFEQALEDLETVDPEDWK